MKYVVKICTVVDDGAVINNKRNCMKIISLDTYQFVT